MVVLFLSVVAFALAMPSLRTAFFLCRDPVGPRGWTEDVHDTGTWNDASFASHSLFADILYPIYLQMTLCTSSPFPGHLLGKFEDDDYPPKGKGKAMKGFGLRACEWTWPRDIQGGQGLTIVQKFDIPGRLSVELNYPVLSGLEPVRHMSFACFFFNGASCFMRISKEVSWIISMGTLGHLGTGKGKEKGKSKGKSKGKPIMDDEPPLGRQLRTPMGNSSWLNLGHRTGLRN